VVPRREAASREGGEGGDGDGEDDRVDGVAVPTAEEAVEGGVTR